MYVDYPKEKGRKTIPCTVGRPELNESSIFSNKTISPGKKLPYHFNAWRGRRLKECALQSTGRGKRSKHDEIIGFIEPKMNDHIMVKYMNGKWYKARVVSYNSGDCHLRVVYDGSSYYGKASTGEEETVRLNDIKILKSKVDKSEGYDRKEVISHVQEPQKETLNAPHSFFGLEKYGHYYFFRTEALKNLGICEVGRVVDVLFGEKNDLREMSVLIYPIRTGPKCILRKPSCFPIAQIKHDNKPIEVPLSHLCLTHRPQIVKSSKLENIFVLSSS